MQSPLENRVIDRSNMPCFSEAEYRYLRQSLFECQGLRNLKSSVDLPEN